VFKHTKAAAETKDKMNNLTLSSGRSISVVFGVSDRPGSSGLPGERRGFVDPNTGETFRGNRELQWKIGQLVRSTYQAQAKQTNGNYPAPKQSLVPSDFHYLASLDGETPLESHWRPDMTLEEKISDYDSTVDQRPFHNRYLVVEVGMGKEGDSAGLEKFSKSTVGESNVIEILNFKNFNHLTLKSTRDASILHSAINSAKDTGEGGLIGIDVKSVKYGPPMNTAGSEGKLWFGCSAFIAVDEEKLRKMFELFGEIEFFKIIKNKNCLFINFKNLENSINCRNKLFSFQLAPGHFLNSDFAPPAPEHVTDDRPKRKRHDSVGEEPAAKKLASESIKIDLSKMGESMCTVIARKFLIQKIENENLKNFYLPKSINIQQRTKIDFCKLHLEKLGITGRLSPSSSSVVSSLGTVFLWQFAASDRKDCDGYDALCDYFVQKDRIGFVSSKDGSVVTYFVPPVKSMLEPLGLPDDTVYLTAIQMTGTGGASAIPPPPPPPPQD
jgi:hypothetical protein